MADEELLDEELDEEFDEEDGKKSGKLKVIAMLGVSAILGVGGGTFVLPSFLGETEAAAETSGGGDADVEHGGMEAVGSVHSITNLVVNARGSDGNRLLVATVAIEVDDASALEELRERDIRLRDDITSILESIPMGVLVRLGARDTVKERIRVMLEPYLSEEIQYRVYVPQFVLQ